METSGWEGKKRKGRKERGRKVEPCWHGRRLSVCRSADAAVALVCSRTNNDQRTVVIIIVEFFFFFLVRSCSPRDHLGFVRENVSPGSLYRQRESEQLCRISTKTQKIVFISVVKQRKCQKIQRLGCLNSLPQ